METAGNTATHLQGAVSFTVNLHDSRINEGQVIHYTEISWQEPGHDLWQMGIESPQGQF